MFQHVEICQQWKIQQQKHIINNNSWIHFIIMIYDMIITVTCNKIIYLLWTWNLKSLLLNWTGYKK